MTYKLRYFSLAWFIASTVASAFPIIGESEKVYTLARENTEVRGVAFDSISPESPRLFVLDQSGKVFTYRPERKPGKGNDTLTSVECWDLPASGDGSPLAGPRGLTFTLENGRPFLYFLNWSTSKEGVTSQLWRWRIDDNSHSVIDLSLFPFRIGEREVFDLSCDKGKMRVCFDASGYTDNNRRVMRGIVQLEWNQGYDGKLEFVKHLPDSGESTSRGLTAMELEGASYLWATVGDDYIYAAEAVTGRGLFHFDRPRSTEGKSSCWGLCFGADALWVPENVKGKGPDRLHRVNVTRDLDARKEGPRIYRHLIMTISTEPEVKGSGNPGKVYHYYSRPYAYEQLGNQGVWPETERVVDVSKVPNATIEKFFHDPGGDVSSRQVMQLVKYAEAPARTYSSKYEIDLWTNRCRTYVYPHRVNLDRDALKGTNYLADDPDLFNLGDTGTYDGFFERVRAHIEKKYGVAADMDHPYWAARNALEYIQDHYYYPSRPKRKPAAVDYDRHHYDANPGNLKIELSGRPYDKSQIIACSGTSVMMAGAMRYLGFPARWLGTGNEQGPETWDTNGNGLLDKEESAPVTSGHRYTQVWLGTHYGWTCFDATPTRPEFNDFDPPPPIRSQWRYMNRAAAGHMKDRRIVFNVGSELFRPLYRDFEYDERLAVNNDCGGDQRYNLQGRFEKPELWKLAKHRIKVTNSCFITQVTVSGPRNETRVAWDLEGDWHKDPDARVDLYLQRIDPDTGKVKDLGRVARSIPCDAGKAVVDLSAYDKSTHDGKQFRIILRKEGDSETGGQSPRFELD